MKSKILKTILIPQPTLSRAGRGVLVFMGVLSFLTLTPVLAIPSAATPEDKILSKAFSAYMDGNDKAAMGYFEEVVRLNPSNEAAKKGLEKVKVRLKKAGEIEKEKALTLAKAKTAEGKGFLRNGDVVGAIDSFHSATNAVPNYAPAEGELKTIKKEMLRNSEKKRVNLTQWALARGTLAYLEKDWAKAYRIWSERLRIDKSDVVLSNANARAENNFKRLMIAEQEEFFRRGARAFYGQGMYEQAKISWEKVLALRGDDQEALEGMARSEQAVLAAQGKGKDNQMTDLLEEGLQQYANQNWTKALSVFQQLSEMESGFTTAKEYIVKINAHLENRVYSPASTAGTWKPNKASNQSNSPLDLSDKNENVTESKKELEKQLNRDPGNIKVQQELDKVVKQQEDEGERIYKDGLIAYSQGNRALAMEHWKKVLIVNPEHKKASAALKKAKAEEERSTEPAATE
ncbi:MAG: tetratricopeptide repeat protein [Elusimicrobiota bacterium]